MEEIWRDIKDYEGFYQVSNCGRVKSLERYKKGKGDSFMLVKEHIMKPVIIRNYLYVHLRTSNSSKQITVHKLVAMAFPEICGAWFPGAQIDHKDGDKLNNRAENLWWCTASQNQNNPITIERQKITQSKEETKEKHRIGLSKSNSTTSPIKVIQFSVEGKFINEYNSIMDAKKHTGVCRSQIRRCCLGLAKLGGGYIWKYS